MVGRACPDRRPVAPRRNRAPVSRVHDAERRKTGSGATQALAPLVREQVREQVEGLEHLLARIPPGALTSEAPPIRTALPLAMLLGHLLACLAGVCAVLVLPEKPTHSLRSRPSRVRWSRSRKPADSIITTSG